MKMHHFADEAQRDIHLRLNEIAAAHIERLLYSARRRLDKEITSKYPDVGDTTITACYYMT